MFTFKGTRTQSIYNYLLVCIFQKKKITQKNCKQIAPRFLFSILNPQKVVYTLKQCLSPAPDEQQYCQRYCCHMIAILWKTVLFITIATACWHNSVQRMCNIALMSLLFSPGSVQNILKQVLLFHKYWTIIMGQLPTVMLINIGRLCGNTIWLAMQFCP